MSHVIRPIQKKDFRMYEAPVRVLTVIGHKRSKDILVVKYAF